MRRIRSASRDLRKRISREFWFLVICAIVVVAWVAFVIVGLLRRN